MKTLFVLAALVAAACAVPLASEPEDHVEAWANFKTTHGKTYESEREEARRFQIFVNNRNKIAAHNARFAQGLESHELGMNKYGDMPHKEFVATMNGYNRPARNGATHTPLKPAAIHKASDPATLPDTVDWRTQGLVTAIKDQGQCGSCWSFSTTGSLEGQLAKKTGKLVSLSEQNLIDCTNNKIYSNEGCNGGWMDASFQYIKDNKGIDVEASYPYEGQDDTCRYSVANNGGTDSGFVDVTAGSEADLKDAVGTVGPVSVAIDASPFSFQFYKSGIFHSWFCSTTALDHGVLVIGYGTDNGKDYWLVKNSWGTTWGMDGYFKLARNKKNACGIATKASYPTV